MRLQVTLEDQEYVVFAYRTLYRGRNLFRAPDADDESRLMALFSHC
ncbi:hypothetical protein ABAC402_05365 [Asticcacaulis sp. AC402]|nr:hypothetical protein ABAC402_05365 [Asticcacaulis sp. AC402]